MKFKNFCKKSEFVELILNEFNNTNLNEINFIPNKVWSGKKADILDMWRNLRPDLPIILTPLSEKIFKSKSKRKTSYGEDGIRISGSAQFIISVLSRLKEIIGYENPQTRLRLVFKGVESKRDARPDRQSYVFYINLERRSLRKPGRPKNL
jgi:hypothetical protein